MVWYLGRYSIVYVVYILLFSSYCFVRVFTVTRECKKVFYSVCPEKCTAFGK